MRRHRPQLEALEDRITPAFNLTISTDPTVGVDLANGVFTATASGANINVAAILFELNIGNNVTINNGTGGGEAGNITWLAGANLSYNGFAARSLVITADSSSSNGAINLQSQVSTTTTLHQAYNAKGDLVVAAALRAGAGTMLLVSTIGSVSENSGATVAAANIGVSALDAVTLDQANDVTTGVLAAVVTGAGQSFTFTDANDLTIGTVLDVAGITTNNGPIVVTTNAGPLTVNQNVSAGAATIDLTAGGGESTFTNSAVISNTAGNTIHIEANRMALNGAPGVSTITAGGGGRVDLEARLANRPIDLGATTDPTGVLSLSNAEFDTITTTGVLQIGDGNEGNVSVTAAVGPNNVPTLTIDTAGGITGGGAIAVSNLRLSASAAVSLTGSNMVGTLAAEVSNNGAGFTFQNTGPLTIGVVDTVAGITTNNGPIVITTTTGAITVTSAVAAGSANITLTTGAGAAVFNAGAQVSAVNGSIAVNAVAIILNSAATLQVTGIGNITLTTDNLDVAATATISANDGVANGNNVVTIRNLTAGRPISLGSDLNLGMTDAELDRIQAETLVIGRNDATAAGTITIIGQIDLTGGANSVPTLHLRTGAGVVDGTLTEQSDIRVSALAVEAVAGIGSADDLDVTVSMLAAINAGAAASGNIRLTNTGALTIAPVDGVAGVQRIGGSVGNIIVVTSLALTVNAPVFDTTGGDITLTADVSNSNNAAAVLTINAALTASGGNGDITMNGNTLVQNSATVGVANAGAITANFGGSGGAATFNNGAILAALSGLIDVTATTAITLNGSATIATTGAGSIRLTTDDVAIAGTALIGLSNVVAIRNFTAGRAINLGTNTTLGLTDAELDRITANVLIIGRNDASAAGDITVSAAVDLSHGANVVSLLHLLTGASVVQSGSGILTVNMLAANAGGGIGVVATPLQTAAGTFAASVGSGGVFLSSRGSMTIGSVDGIDGVTATGGAIVISTIGVIVPGVLTVNENVQTTGDITLTARETTPSRPGDNLSVNAGVTIASSAGAVALQAGDGLTLAAGAVVQAADAVTLVGGFGDDGNGGAVNFFGSAIGASVSVHGSAGNDAFAINPTSTVADVTIDGMAGSDTFAVTPKATTTFNVIGGLPTPPAKPGDVLSVDTAGTTAPTLTFTSTPSGLQGSYTFGNRQPVNFQQIETLTTVADAAVNKIDRPDPVIAGQVIAYTLTVSNLGGIDAQNVELTDAVPVNTTFVSFTQNSGPAFTLTSPPAGGGGDVTATAAKLGAGQSATFALVVRANAGLPNNTLISNTATVTTDTIENFTANNAAIATTRIGPVQYLAVGAATGALPRVAVYSRTGALVGSFLAYSRSFTGGVRVAVGDVNGDGTADIITAPGPGARRNVQVIDGTKLNLIPPGGRVPAAALLASFRGFPGQFASGIFVAAGDVNADGRDDVIIGAGGGVSRVRVFDGAQIASATLVASFLAYPRAFTSGVTVAAGDVNGDGRADLVVAPARGARRVEVIDATKLGLVGPGGTISGAAFLGNFFAFARRFAGGVNVAAGDVNGDRRADVIVAPASRAVSQVKVIDATRVNLVTADGQISASALLANQVVFAQSFRGGVQVGAMELDLDGLAEVLVGTGPRRRQILGLDMLQGGVELNLTTAFAATSVAGI